MTALETSDIARELERVTEERDAELLSAHLETRHVLRELLRSLGVSTLDGARREIARLVEGGSAFERKLIDRLGNKSLIVWAGGVDETVRESLAVALRERDAAVAALAEREEEIARLRAGAAE